MGLGRMEAFQMACTLPNGLLGCYSLCADNLNKIFAGIIQRESTLVIIFKFIFLILVLAGVNQL